ncbi:MAG: response regulator transcription factor [Bacteroidota bacterium]
MNILICDDHAIIREGLRQILLQLPDVIAIKEAGSAKEVLVLLNEETFDIVLLDITLPDKNGLDTLQSIKAKYPSLKVLMISMHPYEQYAIRALKLGASGYLRKDTSPNELLMAIRRITNGGIYVSDSLAENMASQLQVGNLMKHETLSNREFEIMLRLSNGTPLQEIGNELFISNKTVSTYRSRIMEKMGFTKNTDLTKYCIENNLT